jgi:glycosyltransferase involved in cell wall biosynthesis
MRLLLSGQPAYMRSKGLDVVLVSSEGEDWNGIPDIEHYEVYKVPMSRAIDLYNDLRALWRLMALFKKVKPDIVHSHTPKAGMLAMLAGRITGVPVRMHTVAGLPLMESRGIKRKVLVWAEKLTYSCAHGVYPNSHKLKAYIEEQAFTPSYKLKVLASGSSNGINTEQFKPSSSLVQQGRDLRRKWGLKEGDLLFVFIGRLVKDKGINELVQAFASLDSLYNNAWLLLVGPEEADLDPIDPHAKATIRQHPRIIATGFAQDVKPYLAASDILVFPSYREGFPNVPMQAGCFGLPSIVTDINGCNEIIEPGINGLIVPPKNTQALLEAMEQLLSDEGLRSRCASVSRERIEQRYKQETVWESIYDEYRRLTLIDSFQ